MSSKYIFGSILILIGIGLILGQAGIWNFWNVLLTWWPVFLIGFGLSHIVSTRKSMTAGLIFTVIGLLLLASNLNIITSFWGVVWPVAIIMLGIWIIFSRKIKKRVNNTLNKENDYLVIFGGLHQNINNDDFQQATITTIFGGAEIDLREAIIKEDKAELDLTVVFGGIELYIPDDWEVRTSGTPILGALEDHTIQRSDPDEIVPILHITYTAILGGIEVKNGKYGRKHKYKK
jgi:predicted membrane protein